MKLRPNRVFASLCTAAVVAAASSSILAPMTADANTVVNGIISSTAINSPLASAAKSHHKPVISPSSKKKTAKAAKRVKKSAVTKKKAKPVKKKQTLKYKDGTWTGVGQTMIGAVQVAVTLKSDKIVKVQIQGYSTHYPISYIDPILPNELLQRQDINKIDVISGATLSTADFYYAVVSALNQAHKAVVR